MFWSKKEKPEDKSANPAIANVGEALGSLGHRERLQALIYAFTKARDAGDKSDGEFDADAACRALDSGSLRLTGSREQIAAQLLLIEGASGLVNRALSYPVIETGQPALEPPKTGPVPIGDREPS